MRGITPVIAIILLLLMAVAAAGGFYFVYQGFTESGQESGSTQIEQLGEQTLAKIKIESAAGGRIYIRNTGATTVDLSKASVYVENRPVTVNRSADTLAEKERAVLKLTEAPECTADRCEVRISGTASTSETIDLSRLICSSSSDCYSGEACEGGVCVEGEGGTNCGDGECDEGEHGWDCWEDCHINSILAMQLDGMEKLIASYSWTGSTYSWSSNLTSTETGDWDPPRTMMLSNWDAIAAASVDIGDGNREIGFFTYDGSAWSYPDNITDEFHHLNLQASSMDVNSTEDAIVVWCNTSLPDYPLKWASVVDGVPSQPQTMEDISQKFGGGRGFAFEPNDNGYLFWGEFYNAANDAAISYRKWDDGWGAISNLTEYQDNKAHVTGLDFDESGNGMLTWVLINETNHAFMKYATYDGSSWTYQGNAENWEAFNETPGVDYSLNYDHLGNPLQRIIRQVSSSPPVHYTQFHRYANGAWSTPFNITGDPMSYADFVKAPDGTVLVPWGDLSTFMSGELDHYWTVWNGNSFTPSVAIE